MRKFTKNNIKTILVAFGLIGASAFISFNGSIAQSATSNTKPMPGMWEFSTKAAGFYNDNDKYCLSQVEIDRFYSNPCKKNTVCTYTTKNFASDGTVQLVGKWVDKKNRVSKVNTKGTFKPDNLKLKGNVTFYNVPIPITFEAKRLSAKCS